MTKLLQIASVDGVSLFGKMVRLKVDLSKHGVGIFCQSTTKKSERAKWSHAQFKNKNWIKLREIATRQ